jgi:DNA-binding CsgD family transcriptional regulator
LRALAESGDLVVALRLCALGFRNEADERLRVSALPGTVRAGLAAGSTAGDSLAVEVDRLARAGKHSRLPEVASLLRLCRAEQGRTGTADQSPGWAEVAAGWEKLKRPYQTAYARWRQAEAAARNGMAARRPANRKTREDMAAQARDAARQAHRLGTQLRAEPLLAEIEALVRGARIDLAAGEPDPRGTPASAPATDSFGLTPREREVLALVCAGWSNRKIARKLFIAEKTAGVHVSNILRKLQVPRRGEAAAVANRLNLLDQPTAE